MVTHRNGCLWGKPPVAWLCGLFCILIGYVLGSSSRDASHQEPFLLGRLLSPQVEGEQEPEEEEDDDEQLDLKDLRTVISIAIILILLTIAFELFKEHLHHTVPEDMEIILEKLFGELTVLGFLSIVTFVITQTGLFERLSEMIYGGHEELLEAFEYVHFTIFFIMIFFVVQVLVLAKEAGENEEYWLALEKACQHPDGASSTTREEAQHRPNWFRRLCGPTVTPEQEQKIFRGLRREFLLERSVEHPFYPVPEAKRVDEDVFDFGRYLALAQAHTLTHVIEVKIGTWFFFVLSTVVFYYIAVSVHESVLLLGLVWVGIGWVVFLFDLVFELHLIRLRDKFVPRSVVDSVALSQRPSFNEGDTEYVDAAEDETENSALISNSPSSLPLLPAWCDFDLDRYLQRQRPWMVKMMVGGTPNRHQACFWMDQRGPDFYVFILQANLIFTGIYAGLLILLFIPSLYHHLQWSFFYGYVALAALPALGITYNKKQVIAALSQCCSIGTYRKAQIVSDVMREVKIRRIVRAFVVVTKMRHTARSAHTVEPGHHTGMARSSSFVDLEQVEVGRVFDAFDLDGSSSISREEFKSVLARLGADEFSPEEFESLFKILDPDRSGKVTKEEFIHWYAVQAEDDNITLHERAKDLFHMFDSDNNGEITIGEFKSKIDALDMDFSVDDVGCLLSEVDRDRRGTVTLHELEHLLEKYYPKELLKEQ